MKKNNQINKYFVPFSYLPNSIETTYSTDNEQREMKNKLKINTNGNRNKKYIQPPIEIIKIKENEGITLLQNNQFPKYNR